MSGDAHATAPIDRLLIATKNKGKAAEFRDLLAAAKICVEDLSSQPDTLEVEETGQTFRDNAMLKAEAYARQLGVWALADDSGLAVDALNGSPGIYSARWAQRHDAGAGDAANNQLLLEQLQAIPDQQRAARFICVLALADPQGRTVLTAMDSMEGRILQEPRGANGFGYDPLFFIDSLQQTTAQLSAEQKHAISHRGKAMRHMVRLMRENRLVRHRF